MSEREPGLWAIRDGLGVNVETIAIYVVAPLFLTIVSVHHGSLAFWLSSYVINLIVGTCIGTTMTLLYHHLWPRLLPRRPAWPAQVGAHLATALVGTFGGGEIALWLCVLLFRVDVDAGRASIHRTGFVVSLVVVGILVAYDRLRAQAQRSEQAAQAAQQAAQAAQLAAMRAQLDALVARTNPHFLFNSLNSVAALIPEDPARAEAMLERLAALFRYALDGARRREVTLREEIAIARDYLEIETIRLGDRLSSAVTIDGDVDAIAVPPLSLQPLVENAIVHGVAPRRGPGRVDIRIERAGDRVHLIVDDDGDGVATTAGSRSALADLRARLALLHGDAATLDAGPRHGGGWRARISLPARPLRADASDREAAP